MRLVCSGGTRIVFVTRKHVFKFPRVGSWKQFVQGMLSNITEGQWKNFNNPHLCPIKYSNRLGLLVVMQRALPVHHKGLFLVELERLYSQVDLEKESPYYLSRDFFDYDAFPKNFGYINGNLVKIDYGV